jgi:tetratricopeptide (TPR) repeat protein
MRWLWLWLWLGLWCSVWGQGREEALSEAQGLMHERRFSDAFAALERLYEQDTNATDVLYNYAIAADSLQRHKLAIGLNTRLVSLRPKHPYAWHNRGLARAKAGDLRGAIGDFGISIKLDPTFYLSWMRRGTARTFVDSTLAGAIEDFSEAIRLNGGHALSWYNRGNAQFKLGNFFQARSDFGRALALDSSNVPARKNRGLAALQTGEFEVAAGDFSVLLALEPTNWGFLFRRAEAYCKAGDVGRGCADLQGAMRHGPPGYEPFLELYRKYCQK